MGMGLGGIIYNLYTIQDIKVLIKRVCVCVCAWLSENTNKQAFS